MAIPTGYDIKDLEKQKFVDDGLGNVAVRTTAVIEGVDIEIGAVEIKNATDDTRAVVKTDGTNNALVVTQNTVPQTKVEIVTPLGTTCEDEINTSVYTGTRGSVAYDSFNNTFLTRIFGLNSAGTVTNPFTSIYLNGSTSFAGTEYGLPIAAKTDSSYYAVPLMVDGSSYALLIQPIDSSLNKQSFSGSGHVLSDLFDSAGTGLTATGTALNVNIASGSLVSGTNLIGGVMVDGASGTGSDTSITLTVASTAYSFPASPPAVPYLLVACNNSDTAMMLRFTTGTTLGWILGAGKTQFIDLGASKYLYAYCASAGKVLNVSYIANY